MTEVDPAAPTHTPEGVPLDFAAFEAYRQKQERGETPEPPAAPSGKPAAAPAKAPAAKTAPEPDPATQQTAEEIAAEAADAALPAPKKSGFHRRIDGLNQKLGAKDAEIAELRRTQGAQAPPAAKTPAAAAAPAAGLAPGEPDPAKFDDYGVYTRALARWEVANVRREEAQADSAKAQGAAWKTRTAEAQAAHDDFDDVIAGAAEMPISPTQHQFVTQHKHGQLLAYHFASDPEETARIAALDPMDQAVEIAVLLKTLAPADPKAAAAEKPEPRVSKTPAPPKTVRAAAADSGEPDPKDFPKWEAWRSRQPGASLRR